MFSIQEINGCMENNCLSIIFFLCFSASDAITDVDKTEV